MTCIIDNIILLKANEELMCIRKEKEESYARENVSANFFLERFSATLGSSAHINRRLLLFPLERRWEYSVTNEKETCRDRENVLDVILSYLDSLYLNKKFSRSLFFAML